MVKIDNPELYERVKKMADEKYSKSSAYKSGYIVKTYKQMGGTYTEDGKPKNLQRWYKEDWKDIGDLDYPVYRPTKRINQKTPLLPIEIDFDNLINQILLKQKIKGSKNLPKFEKKGGGHFYEISPFAYKQAKKLGVKIAPSHRKYKKIDVFDYNNQYILSIGDTRYNDFRSYIKERGIEYAENRRRLYKIRHEKTRHNKGSASYYADQLLWN